MGRTACRECHDDHAWRIRIKPYSFVLAVSLIAGLALAFLRHEPMMVIGGVMLFVLIVAGSEITCFALEKPGNTITVDRICDDHLAKLKTKSQLASGRGYPAVI